MKRTHEDSTLALVTGERRIQPTVDMLVLGNSSGNVAYLCEFVRSAHGYPIDIQYADEMKSCPDKRDLERVLAHLLEHPDIAMQLQQLSARKADLAASANKPEMAAERRPNRLLVSPEKPVSIPSSRTDNVIDLAEVPARSLEMDSSDIRVEQIREGILARSPDEIGALGDRIVELLESHPEGLRAEQIREALGVESTEPHPPTKRATKRRKSFKVNEVHVLPDPNRGWVITTNGVKYRKTIDTQRDAIAQGRELARREGAQLVVHGRDGRVRPEVHATKAAPSGAVSVPRSAS